MNFIRSGGSNIFSTILTQGIREKLLKRLRFGLGHVKEHKCKHDFPDFVDTLISCRDSIGTSSHLSPLHKSYTSKTDPLEQNTLCWSKYFGTERKLCY